MSWLLPVAHVVGGQFALPAGPTGTQITGHDSGPSSPQLTAAAAAAAPSTVNASTVGMRSAMTERTVARD